MTPLTPGNGFLGAGDGVTYFDKLISELMQKNSIPHRVIGDCVVWFGGGYTQGMR